MVKKSNILNEWKEEKFDLIINDISAIDSQVAKKYWYNEFIPHDCGKDGIKLTKNFLNNVEKNLNKNGTILLPIISISDHKYLLKKINNMFRSKILLEKEWPAPKNLIYGRVANFLKRNISLKSIILICALQKFTN